MFKRKREITELEKTNIITEYLYNRNKTMCSNHDASPEVEPYVSHCIKFIGHELDFQVQKLAHLRTKSRKSV